MAWTGSGTKPLLSRENRSRRRPVGGIGGQPTPQSNDGNAYPGPVPRRPISAHNRAYAQTTRSQPHGIGGMCGSCEPDYGAEFETIVIDWREIDDLAEFLCAFRRSNRNRDSILVAIVRDLLDLRQAFAAGVHFLIHKPASALQIERCLRAAYCAIVARRRKHHREPVKIATSVSTRNLPLAQAVILNLGEGGAGLRMSTHPGLVGPRLSVGDQVTLNSPCLELPILYTAPAWWYGQTPWAMPVWNSRSSPRRSRSNWSSG